MTGSRRVRSAGIAIMVAACLAACSSSSPAAPTAHAGAAGPLPGVRLRALLDTDLPAGFKVNPDATIDSGEELQDPSSGPMENASHCGDLNATAFIQASGDTGVGFAQNDYIDKDNNEIAQEIDSYATVKAATAAMAALRKFFRQCASFTYKQSGHKYPVKLATSSVAGLGDGAFKGVMTSADWAGGTTLVAAQSGTCVITTFYSSQSADKGSDILAITATIRANLQNMT